MAVIGQGSFTSTGANQVIMVPSNLDGLEVWNFTQANLTAGNGFYYSWQRPSNSTDLTAGASGTVGIVYQSGAAHAVTVAQTAAGAFKLINPDLSPLGAINNGSTALTALTAANPPVATVGSTAGMSAGDIVRLTSLDSNQGSMIGGIDFTAGYGTLTPTTFSLDYISLVGTNAATGGNWRIINRDVLFYPPNRVITKLVTGTTTLITLNVTHQYTVGQRIRFVFPGGSAAWGAYANLTLDPSQAYTIIAVNTATNANTITVDVDTTTMPVFLTQWIAAAITNGPSGAAQIIPDGENTAEALSTGGNILADATRNTGFIGMKLAAGASLPAGLVGNVVYWRAFQVDFGGL